MNNQNIKKKILFCLFITTACFLLINLKNQEKKNEKKAYVEGLYEFFTTGKVIELPDFPETQIFKQFLEEESSHKGLSIEQLKENMKKTGITTYLLNLLKKGHITPVEFVNLMDINWIQAFRIAYSSGALSIPEDLFNLLKGEITPTIETIRNDKNIVVKEIAYQSSIDSLNPLYAEIAYNPGLKNMPIMVCQHGDYPGTRIPMVPIIYELAKKGIFGIAVSKRGRDGSAGRGDAFCKETFDIYDAVEYVKKHYAEYVDPDNINIRGGSGGGMDVFSAIVHFPDYFRVAVPYVAPPDLDHWIRQMEPAFPSLKEAAKNLGGHFEGSWNLFSNIIRDIGGLPSQVPDKYQARNWVLGAINNPYTLIHIFWDEEDGAAPSITVRSKAYLEETKKMGFTNVNLHFSRKGDKIRYLHWSIPDHIFSYHHYLPVILSKSHPAPILADAGRLIILGFVKTKKFLIWLGEGNDAVAKVDYSLNPDISIFYFRRLSKNPSKKGNLVYENSERKNYQVKVNNQIILENCSSRQIAVEFTLDDRVILKRLIKKR